mmetsp:Transcript_22492/g.55659  ORF Transcript_22492/g.55659 Transcript_22492/m.55659 type:complete len:161 (-) Transcript_22492:114-596(-)
MGRQATFDSSKPRNSPSPAPPQQGASLAEAYGFVGFVLTGVMFALYLAWAYTPEAMLHALGVTYYPDKYWAAAGPVWMCAAGLYGAWAYEGVNRMAVRRIDAVELIEEEGGSIPRRLDRPDPPGSVPSIHDIPIGEVNRVLFRTVQRRVRRRQVDADSLS